MLKASKEKGGRVEGHIMASHFSTPWEKDQVKENLQTPEQTPALEGWDRRI